jgi:CheY-like chemotaxis protein
VLIVDDNADGRTALARVLELRGFEAMAVAAGSEALAALHSSGPPRIIITDLVLPDLDGREVARAARQLQPRPWVVLITGWGFEAPPEELAEAGIDLLMPKPVDVRELCRHLDAMAAAGHPQP